MRSEQTARLQERLMSWATARTSATRPGGAPGVATIVAEDPDHVEALLAGDCVDDDSVILSPDEHPDPRVVRYRGSLTVPGDEGSINDELFLQTQEYRSCPYVSVLGPTFVRITHPTDLDVFLRDADAARATGQIADYLLEPALRVADGCALGESAGGAGPRSRLVVRGGGEVSTSPTGTALGAVGDGLAELVRRHDEINDAATQPCAVSLGAVVDDQVRTQALDSRPWLGRYLAGVDAIKALRARGGTGLHLSGFGHRLSSAVEGIDARDETSPLLLLWSDDAAYVVEPATRRTVRIALRTGALVEAILVAGSVEAAAAVVDPTAVAEVGRTLSAAGFPVPSGVLA